MYRAAIKLEDGKMFPLFAGRKTTAFRSEEKALRAVENHPIARDLKRGDMRGYIWPAGQTLADTPWSQIRTTAL